MTRPTQFSLNPANSLSTGLLLAYFGHKQGETTVYDSEVTPINGTWSGAAGDWSEDATLNRYILPNGGSKSCAVGACPTAGLQKASWAFWFQPLVALTNGPSIVACGPIADQHFYALYTNSGNLGIYLATSSSANASGTRNSALALNTRTHIVVTYDGSLTGADKLKLYVDGTLLSWSSTSGTLPATLTTPSAATYLWGGDILGTGGAARYCNGAMSDLGMWSKVLSADEITALATAADPLITVGGVPWILPAGRRRRLLIAGVRR